MYKKLALFNESFFYEQSRPTAQAGARLSAEAKVSYGFLNNLSTKARI